MLLHDLLIEQGNLLVKIGLRLSEGEDESGNDYEERTFDDAIEMIDQVIERLSIAIGK